MSRTHPTAPSRVHALGQLIDTEAADDAVMRSELQQLLEALKDCEPTVVQQAIGNQNVTANNSTVTITFPSASTTPEQPPMQSRWVRGDLYEVVYAGSGTARGVEVSPAVEGMMFRLQDTVPQDLQIGEGISFSFLRYPGVDGDRVVVSWTTDAGEQRSTKLRVPRRLDR